MTDKFPAYNVLNKEFAGRETVDREAGEYMRGSAYTNNLEGWFSLLKRGMNGTFKPYKRGTFRPLCW